MAAHELTAEVDRLVGQYLRLDAKKSATVAAYNEALKDLWGKIEAAHEAAHAAQEPLPFAKPPAKRVCASCGHEKAAHVSAAGDPRPCVLCGCVEYHEAEEATP